MNISLISEIIGRLTTDPDKIAEIIKQRSSVSDELHIHLDIIQEREVRIAGFVADRKNHDRTPLFPNQALRQAEVCRMLKIDSDYQCAISGAEAARKQIRELDAALESATRRNDADNKMIALITALVEKGMGHEVENFLSIYCQNEPKNIANIPTQFASDGSNATQVAQVVDPQPSSQGTTAMVTVLEARPSKNPGTVRAFCTMADGSNVAIYAKNGYGQLLQNSIGKTVKVEYQLVKKGWFAYKVSAA